MFKIVKYHFILTGFRRPSQVDQCAGAAEVVITAGAGALTANGGRHQRAKLLWRPLRTRSKSFLELLPWPLSAVSTVSFPRRVVSDGATITVPVVCNTRMAYDPRPKMQSFALRASKIERGVTSQSFPIKRHYAHSISNDSRCLRISA
jgi:hypothetical protein